MELNAFAKATAFEEGVEPLTLALSAPRSSELSKKKTPKRSLVVELMGLEPTTFPPYSVAGHSRQLSIKKDPKEESCCGAKGSRTPDLLHAMQAL